jgi:hypothetical protein
VQELVMLGYSQGSDPLSRELFNTTFHLSPWSKLALNWQNVGGGHLQTYAYLKALEQEGVHGPQLLRGLVDHVHERADGGHHAFDRMLKHMMQTGMDPYDMFFMLAVRLGNQAAVSEAVQENENPFNAGSQTFFTARAVGLGEQPQEVPSVKIIQVTNTTPGNVVLKDHQRAQNWLYRDLGAPVDGDFAGSVGLTSYLADQLLAQGNASAVFDLFAASRVSDLDGRSAPLPLTAFDLGVCTLLTLNTTAVVAQHPPQTLASLDTSSPVFRTWQNVSQDLTSTATQFPTFPFTFFESPGVVKGNPFVEAINFTRAVLLTPSQRLSRAHKKMVERLRERTYHFQRAALGSSPFRRRLAPVVADVAKLMKANGLVVTSYLWRQVPSLRDRFWRAEEVEALQGELGLILSHSRGSNTAQQGQALSVQVAQTLKQEWHRAASARADMRNRLRQEQQLEMEALDRISLSGYVMGWFGWGGGEPDEDATVDGRISPPSDSKEAFMVKQHQDLQRIDENTLTLGQALMHATVCLSPAPGTSMVVKELVAPLVMKKLETQAWYQELQHFLNEREKDYPIQVNVLRIGGRVALTMVITNVLSFPLSQGSPDLVNTDLFRNTPLGAVTRGMTLQEQIETIRGFSSKGLLDFASRMEYDNMYEAAQKLYGLSPAQIDQYILESSRNSGEANVNLFVQLGQNGLVEVGDLSATLASATTGLFTDEGQAALQNMMYQAAPAITIVTQNVALGRITSNQNELVSLLCRLSAVLEQGTTTLESLPDRHELVSHWAAAWSRRT